MPKVTGPLGSLKASGTIGGTLTFSERKEGSICRYQRKQKDVLTEKRTKHRGLFLDGISAWKALTEEEKEEYKERTKALMMTGYNLFLKEYMLAPPSEWTAAIYGLGIYGRTKYGVEEV